MKAPELARRAWFAHQTGCECKLCLDYEQYLVEEALERDDFDAPDGAYIPEDDQGAYQS